MTRPLFTVAVPYRYREIDPRTMARELEEAVNAHRRNLSLRPLRFSDPLAAAARQHSQRMRNLSFFDHRDPLDGTSAQDRVAAVDKRRWTLLEENLAAGQRTPEQVIAGWLDSPGHRANLEHPGVQELGTAVALGGRLCTYITQLYGRPAPRLEQQLVEPARLRAHWACLRQGLDSAFVRCTTP